MREADAAELASFLEGARDALGDVRGVSVHSPSDLELTVAATAWPGVPVETLGIREWDVRERTPRRHDVLLLCNVMMSVPDPGPAFANLLASCRRLVVLDNCVAYRPFPGNPANATLCFIGLWRGDAS